MRFLIAIIALFLGTSQRGPKLPSAQDVMQNMEKGFADVKDFTVDIEADVNMERLRIPKSTATLYYKKPDKIHFSSSNFIMVPREGIVPNPSLLRERYDATMAGEERIEGRKHFKLQLAAKDPRTHLRQMYLWIDPSNWTISKMETIPYEGRTLTVSFSYGLQREQYWLPLSLHAVFGVVGPDTSKPLFPEGSPAAKEQFEEIQRPTPRSGSIDITYSHYRVNTRLPDSLFEQPETK
ncbi:MAG: hypothetical protein WBD36_11190 [Bacteroidota bacterium]